MGPPRGKGRPRFRSMGKFVSAYTDAATRKYESALHDQAKKVMGTDQPLEGPLAVEIVAYTPIPKSWNRKDTAAALAGESVPTSRPDVDNLSKVVDALNGVVWRDDSQIVDLHVWKFYSAEPRLVIKVRQWGI